MKSLESHCQTKGVFIHYNSEIVSLNYDSMKYTLGMNFDNTIIESKYVINSFLTYYLQFQRQYLSNTLS